MVEETSSTSANPAASSSSSHSADSALSSASTLHGTSTSTTSAPASGGSTASSSDPVLHRLKELEESNQHNAKALERMKKELAEREDKIKLLSADKRKEMESILATAIDNWLNSLSGVSEENRTNFREGISNIAKHADMNNAAWEIVCNASALHNTNVKRIEELLTEAKDRERELGELKGFRTEASRISSIKRPRVDTLLPSSAAAPLSSSSMGGVGGTARYMDPTAATTTTAAESSEEGGHGGNGSAWDMFQGMISRDFRSSYF
jgi:hypothetical protein